MFRSYFDSAEFLVKIRSYFSGSVISMFVFFSQRSQFQISVFSSNVNISSCIELQLFIVGIWCMMLVPVAQIIEFIIERWRLPQLKIIACESYPHVSIYDLPLQQQKLPLLSWLTVSYTMNFQNLNFFNFQLADCCFLMQVTCPGHGAPFSQNVLSPSMI